MTESQQPSVQERIGGLMIMAGAMAIICAIPCGIALGFKDYSIFNDQWSFVFGWSVAAPAVVVGTILVWGGWTITKRCWRLRNKNPA